MKYKIVVQMDNMAPYEEIVEESGFDIWPLRRMEEIVGKGIEISEPDIYEIIPARAIRRVTCKPIKE